MKVLFDTNIYDALIAEAALKANVDMLLTLNPKHFISSSLIHVREAEIP